ncbi:hypothetical protein FQN57_005703 [Myotisia sp. PD_48]|nr:hypothetical protein FQN57_005703 [Myotisia sp. PD_48]
MEGESTHLQSAISNRDANALAISRRSDCLHDTEAENEDKPIQLSCLSTFERVLSTHSPIFESFLLQTPTETILQLYHTSRYLRYFLRSYPTAWQYLSFRFLYPSGIPVRTTISPGGVDSQVPRRQSRPYALDQLLRHVIVPFSPSLRSLDLDSTAVSGQNLISIVLNARRDTLEHLSVRGCKNVSLKYHIIPYLTMFGLQHDTNFADPIDGHPRGKKLALKSLYTYRCRHHRRRPYLTASLLRRDSDAAPTHELVNLCHKLGIWTDTAWCTTPAGRCFRRRSYVSMRVSQGTPEVWVVFDRLWRSKNWVGPSENPVEPRKRDGRLWEQDETGHIGEPLGTADGQEPGEGKTVPTHLRASYTKFVANIKCDGCGEEIYERCEQCSVLMHCVGCRKTLCYSCAYDTSYPRRKHASHNEVARENFWWAPNSVISPCAMQEPILPALNALNPAGGQSVPKYPTLKLHWCCTEPVFTGGGGINIGMISREADRIRAAPLPRGQGYEDPEYSSNQWSRTFPKYAYGDPKRPDYTLAEGHTEMMRWLLGPAGHRDSDYPRNICQECFDSPQWKVHCKRCSKPLCMEHDLRGLRLKICGYRDLILEKIAIGKSRPLGTNAEPDSSSDTTPMPTSTSVAPLRGIAPPQIQAGPSSINEPNTTNSSIPVTYSRAADNSGTNPTSVSSSNNHSRSSTPASTWLEPVSNPQKWIGCQSFFCPDYRATGDHRPRCPGTLMDCASCSVRVCKDCIRDNPPCECSYCDLNYLCPNCYPLKEKDGTCRRLEEEREEREEQQRRDLEMFEVALERNLANQIAGFAGQFFNALEGEGSIYSNTTDGHNEDSGNAPSLNQLDGGLDDQDNESIPATTAAVDEEGDIGAIGSGSEHTE